MVTKWKGIKRKPLPTLTKLLTVFFPWNLKSVFESVFLKQDKILKNA